MKYISNLFVTNSEQQPENPILTFDNKKYQINSLPDSAKGLIRAAQVADNQQRFMEDNLRLITIAKENIAAKLKNELVNQTPIE